ncbi:unnamed protein product [Protopolystoma xenopodis]|uniref:Uncharacterized protein n=1 Tax=Protopolystoma xenopodis TaxID=117903 RepID=A0A3S5AA21_9PLAT|nr:unnamed protein product [Protopolystoma xenopodis]
MQHPKSSDSFLHRSAIIHLRVEHLSSVLPDLEPLYSPNDFAFGHARPKTFSANFGRKSELRQQQSVQVASLLQRQLFCAFHLLPNVEDSDVASASAVIEVWRTGSYLTPSIQNISENLFDLSSIRINKLTRKLAGMQPGRLVDRTQAQLVSAMPTSGHRTLDPETVTA